MFINHFTRDQGSTKPLLSFAVGRFLQGWHHRDLLKVSVVGGLRFSELLLRRDAVAPIPGVEVRITDSFTGSDRRVSHLISLSQFAFLQVEHNSLLTSWYSHLRLVPMSFREMGELRLLCKEFVSLGSDLYGPVVFSATWKTHRMSEAGDTVFDQGGSLYYDDQLVEAANKQWRLLYELMTNRRAFPVMSKFKSYMDQLARARDLILGAVLLRLEQGSDVHDEHNPELSESDACSVDVDAESEQPGSAPNTIPSPTPEIHTTVLLKRRYQLLVSLVVNERSLAVEALDWSRKGTHGANILLEEFGYTHLYWALLCHLGGHAEVHTDESELLELETRDLPVLTLDVSSGIRFGTDADGKHGTLLRCDPFTFDGSTELVAHFITIQGSDGVQWVGMPVMFATCTTYSGTAHDIAYIKWLTVPLTGVLRAFLPLPAHFPMYQWAESHMGLFLSPSPSPNFSVINVSSIESMVPIVKVIEDSSFLTLSMSQHLLLSRIVSHRRISESGGNGSHVGGKGSERRGGARAGRGRGRARSGSSYEYPEEVLVPGPVFALNVDVFIAHSGKGRAVAANSTTFPICRAGPYKPYTPVRQEM